MRSSSTANLEMTPKLGVSRRRSAAPFPLISLVSGGYIDSYYPLGLGHSCKMFCIDMACLQGHGFERWNYREPDFTFRDREHHNQGVQTGVVSRRGAWKAAWFPACLY